MTLSKHAEKRLGKQSSEFCLGLAATSTGGG